MSPDVKLCLFDGELKTLSLHLKAESLHFGLDYNGSVYSKKWRNNDGKEDGGPSITVEINGGVLNLDNLLATYKKTKPPGVTSSAQLALQLLEGVDEVRWTAV